MNLHALHSLMSKNGFHYFEGKTNSTDNNLYLSFSTGNKGHGELIDLRIGSDDNHDIEYTFPNIQYKLTNLHEQRIFELLYSAFNKTNFYE
jgi:hypothetical protein